jgi:AcrR family transcriptional regulator
LAEDGARGLTHLRVDRRAGVADGTTSFYFQTRAALLRGVTDRLVSQDLADFTTAMNAARSADTDHTGNLLSQLAVQAMRTGIEPERSRARARFEMMLIAGRNPELGTVFERLMEQFITIGEECRRPGAAVGVPPDRELIKEQALAVINFLGGFLFRLANGLSGPDTAKQLEGYLYAVIAGVAAEHPRIRDAK